uniref:Major capsid protein N-terminal domain-containing protein n=1 Tax=viral metagenome TaxID=1070528 RepID=A0A6C0J213_9ZZZZ
MGSGGLMQLVAYGMQDVYLTGNSQITFFKNLYRRHTNFSCEAVEQTFQSNSTSFGNKLVAVISRNGDLLHRLWLEVSLKESTEDTTYVSKFGHALIKSAEVEIGGQRIDKIYGRFTHLWHKLSCRAEKEAGYELMTGNDGPDFVSGNGMQTARKLYIPINFWFSKGSAGAALPLIALQYHEVRISIELAAKSEVLRTRAADKDTQLANNGASNVSVEEEVGIYTTGSSTDIEGMADPPKLYSDFFYLDTDERRRFSQMSHEYLIEQLQFTGSEVTSALGSEAVPFSMRLNFNHPTKAIYWTTEITGHNEKAVNPFYNGWRLTEPAQIKSLVASGDYAEYHDNCPIDDVQLQLNGHERFSTRKGSYFHLCQPYQHHTRVPYDHWVGMYSFCLSPEEHQPSGALNFSRIDNASLKLKFKRLHTGTTGHTRTVYVYAVNYNVLRILSGMGGLAFSN